MRKICAVCNAQCAKVAQFLMSSTINLRLNRHKLSWHGNCSIGFMRAEYTHYHLATNHFRAKDGAIEKWFDGLGWKLLDRDDITKEWLDEFAWRDDTNPAMGSKCEALQFTMRRRIAELKRAGHTRAEARKIAKKEANL